MRLHGKGMAAMAEPDGRSPAGITSDGFREAMSHLAGGVVLVTTEVGGRPWGLTITACCSISSDPPLVCISLQQRTVTASSILAGKRFELSLLSSAQLELARHGSAVGAPKFLDELSEPRSASDEGAAQARRDQALATMQCSLQQVIPLSDHSMMIGRVESAVTGTASQPLVYWRRQYLSVGS
jgi:flavin reductase ActVB